MEEKQDLAPAAESSKKRKRKKQNDVVTSSTKTSRKSFLQKRRVQRRRHRFNGKSMWSLPDAVNRERTAFGRTICALESGDAVNQGRHPETIPILLWNDSDTAPLELLQRSHNHPTFGAGDDRSLSTRLQTIDERWYIRQSQSESTDIEVIRRKRGVARQTSVSGVSTLYIPPGIETVMPAGGKTHFFSYGSTHASPDLSSFKLSLEQKVVIRSQSGTCLLKTRGRTILRNLRDASKADTGFVLRDFMIQLRQMARAKLVYAVFQPLAEGKAFKLGLSFSLDRRGRYFGQFLFLRCLISEDFDKTCFGERRWLSSVIPHGSKVEYSCHACGCKSNRE